VEEKWYLITSIDDYSRYLLYAEIVAKETSWRHILALEEVCLRYGFPLSYYVDSHSIFRFLESRDSVWRTHYLKTDEADPQWKQVLRDCRIKPIYALSPQAKGKAERPYRWLQDRVVRTCARENLRTVAQVREVLQYEIRRYNEHQVHSVTREVPALRFEKAIREGRTLFRPFKVPSPFQSTKDLFCLREERVTDAYRKISFDGVELKVPGVNPHEKVLLRMIPDEETGLTEIRFWHKDRLVGAQKIRNCLLKRVHF
jgi:hypothetical protein